MGGLAAKGADLRRTVQVVHGISPVSQGSSAVS
jgi:hypothetical protein